MKRAIAFAHNKGGTGKTTSCVSLGAALVERGHRVLLVDVDPQGHLAQCLGFEPDRLGQTIYDALSDVIRDGSTDPHEIILPTDEGMDLLPSNLDLSLAELDLQNAIRREYVLTRVLEPVRPDYGYILIDCPPSLGILVVNALAASDAVIVPMQAEFLAAKGVGRLLKLIERVRRTGLNPDLAIEGLLLTMAHQRTTHAREVIEGIRATYDADSGVGGLRVFQAVIPRSIRFPEAAASGQSILAFGPGREVAGAYRQLAEEVDCG